MNASETTPLDFIYLPKTENRVYIYNPIYFNYLFDFNDPRPFRGVPVNEANMRQELRSLAQKDARVVFVSRERGFRSLFEYRLGIEMEELETPPFRGKNCLGIYGVYIPKLSTYRDPILAKNVDFYWEIRPIYYRFDVE